MNRIYLVLGAFGALLVAQQPANAQVTTTFYQSIGPNANSSPNAVNAGGYYDNAINGLIGTGNLVPGTFASNGNAASSFSTFNGALPVSGMLATTINSWMGVTPPPGAFAGEFGNSLFFGASFVSTAPGPTGTQFNLDSVTFAANGTGNGASIVPAISPINYAGLYGLDRVGIQDTNANGIIGDLGDTFLANGEAGSTLVDAIFIIGPAGSFDLSTALNQADIDAQLAAINLNPGSLTGTFTLSQTFQNQIPGGPGAQANGGGAIVPEPASMAVLGLGVVGLLGYTYRRRQAAAAVAC